MPIRAHLPENNTFEPAAVDAMSRAFQDICAALHVFAGDIKGREIVATRIIDLARKGLLDPSALRDRIVLESRTGA